MRFGYSTWTYRIYVDFPWSEDVRKWGAPKRIYIHTKHWMWMIGLWPGNGAQVWNGTEGYSEDKFAWIVHHPKGNLHHPDACGTPLVVLMNHKRKRREAEAWLEDKRQS